jgi:hypothetical protein
MQLFCEFEIGHSVIFPSIFLTSVKVNHRWSTQVLTTQIKNDAVLNVAFKKYYFFIFLKKKIKKRKGTGKEVPRNKTIQNTGVFLRRAMEETLLLFHERRATKQAVRTSLVAATNSLKIQELGKLVQSSNHHGGCSITSSDA